MWNAPSFVAREVPVGEVGAERVHPVLDLGRDRDPDAILRIAQDEVHLADRLAIDLIGQHAATRPSRDMISSRSVPKLEIRKSPFRVNASPFGNVPVEISRGLALGGAEPGRTVAG